MNFVNILTNPDFMIAAFAAISAAAVVFTFGSQYFDRAETKDRIRRVALERDKMRAEEMQRLRGVAAASAPGSIRRAPAKSYMSGIVENLSLRKAFTDDNTVDALARAGYRAPGHLTTYVFLRFVTPIVVFVIGFAYLGFVVMADKPLYLNALYALGIGLAGSYLPVLLLKNRTIKRQKTIRRAWPDCLDLMLLCVEAGMSVEHAFKRVAAEMGDESPALSEELALTNAELSFLEDRTRAYENLGRRTGLDGVRAVMTALIQSERYGTSVGQALRVMAEEGREMRLNEAEKKAAQLPPKLTVPLIVFFLPVLFIVIMAPALIKAFGYM